MRTRMRRRSTASASRLQHLITHLAHVISLSLICFGGVFQFHLAPLPVLNTDNQLH